MGRWQWMKILTAALTLIVLGGCLIAAGAFGGYLEDRGLDDADRIASVVGMVLAGAGLHPEWVHAVRVFADLVPGSLLDLEPGATAALVELEKAVATRAEYLPLAAQLHAVARR